MFISLEKTGKAFEVRMFIMTELKKTLYYTFWPLRIIYKIYYLVVFSLLMALTYPRYRYLLSDPKRFPRAFRMMKSHARLLLATTGTIPRVFGIDRVPTQGPYIICANHTSFLDPFCLYAILQNYFVFTGKKEIEKWPLFHIFYTSGMNILVDRSTSAGAFASFRKMAGELRKGNPLVIFPEGTRSKYAPELAPFKPGAFALAIQMQVPVVPVTFKNNWKRLGTGGFFKGHAGPGMSRVVIHPPISTAGMDKSDVDVLTSKVREIIGGSMR